MASSARISRDGDILRVQGELDFDSVAELWETSETLLVGDAPLLRIDLSRVSRSNSAGVALLAQWLCQARRRQRELLFVGIPAQMRAIIRVVDLETLLPTA
ncbi:MAG TPA: STAS domain-containing protein [Candidatus Competibacter sp.]|nr:STAS domain-containing protein [Candidatus Competibacteraceae bacterium]HPE74372.1 STAS domain-containing protein [Candidatus Competibacter sp.]HRW65052.1 STAS domain-containing protein [Candidatus Competibacter sp.]